MITAIQAFLKTYFCLGKKFLVFNLISRNLKIKYRRSVLGVFWTILAPLALTAIYYFVFKVVFHIKTQYYLVFILSGTLSWAFFAQSLSEGMESIVGSHGLLNKVPIPVQVFPYVGGLTNFVTFLLATPVLALAALVSGAQLAAPTLMLPVLWLSLFLITYGLSFILALAYVYLRDLKHALTILLQIWFYATPVIYDEAMIPPQYRWILFANPVGQYFVALHDVLIRAQWPSAQSLVALLAWPCAITCLAGLVHRHWSHEIVENL